MNAANITDSEIEDYLLGAVLGDVAERIDELIFIDTDFAARVEGAERDLIDEYSRKELDAESLKRFESYYLSSPRRREKVRLGNSFGEFIASADPKTEHPIRAAPIVEEKRSGWAVSWWKIAIPAFAAAVLLAVAVPLWLRAPTQQTQVVLENTNRKETSSRDSNQLAVSDDAALPSPEPSATSKVVDPANEKPTKEPESDRRRPAPSVFAITLMPQMRSSQRETQISVPSGTDRAAIILKLEPTDLDRVRVILTNEAAGSVVWQGVVRPSKISAGYQSASLSIPARSLTPGRYRVTAAGPSGDTEIIGDYQFRIVP